MPDELPDDLPDADWSSLAGMFLVLDGGEGCGKSTQARRLAGFLAARGLVVRPVRDPGSTVLGEKIRNLLLDPANDAMAMRCEMLLYMAARAQLVSEVIAPAIGAGEVVVCDRFVSSTLAYQLGGDGLTVAEIEAVAGAAIAGRWPDLTVVLDVPTEIAQLRVVPKFVPLFDQLDRAEDPSKDRIERRPEAYHRQVRDNYLAQARRHPDRHAVVDASRGPDAVFEEVRRVVARLAGG